MNKQCIIYCSIWDLSLFSAWGHDSFTDIQPFNKPVAVKFRLSFIRCIGFPSCIRPCKNFMQQDLSRLGHVLTCGPLVYGIPVSLGV